MSPITTFCQDEDNKKQLGVSGRDWTSCNADVHAALAADWVVNLDVKLPTVLDHGIKVLVYSGDKDFICNWRGGEAWTDAVDWNGHEEYSKLQYADWMVDGKAAGALKSHKNFKFLRVYDAGHMVPMDQPKNALSMLREFITGGILSYQPEAAPKFIQ